MTGNPDGRHGPSGSVQSSGITRLSESSYAPLVRGLTIKLTDDMLRKLAEDARTSGRSVAAVVREKLQAQPTGLGESSVHAQAGDLAGVLVGSRRSATNERRKFRRS